MTRAGIEAIEPLAATIVQSGKFGTSLALALKVYAEDLRKKRIRLSAYLVRNVAPTRL